MVDNMDNMINNIVWDERYDIGVKKLTVLTDVYFLLYASYMKLLIINRMCNIFAMRP